MKLFNISMAGMSVILFVGILAACVQLGATEKDAQTAASGGIANNYVQCNTPRPEICYELYQPVCAKRDAGVRCTTAPCPSTELITYSNDCKACSDVSVLGFIRGGACKGSSIAADLFRGNGM